MFALSFLSEIDMERTIISFDYAIKEILRDKANFDILSGFLTELLGRQVNVQEILESEGSPPGKGGKVNRLDLKAKIDDGELAVFEIQFADQIDFLGKVLFNACKAVVEQVSAGKLYDVKKVFSINIAYFDMGAKNEYVFTASLNEFRGVHFDETIPFSLNLDPLSSATREIHPEYFLILPNKFDEQIRSKFDEWVYVLKNSSVRSEFTAAGVQAAGEKLDVMKMTAEERIKYEKDKVDTMARKTEVYTAELKGEKRGRAEGEAIGLEKGEAIGLEKGETIGLEKGLEIAVVNACKKGYPIDEISGITSLLPEQIAEILKKHGLI
jgi:predicted transposase/invertase (TIGR01784 family)